MIARPGNMDIQLVFSTMRTTSGSIHPFTNISGKRSHRCSLFWGIHDHFFSPAGAEAYWRDNPNATVQFLDTGHFATETHVEEIALAMRECFAKTVG
jgi:hypothetical protein